MSLSLDGTLPLVFSATHTKSKAPKVPKNLKSSREEILKRLYRSVKGNNHFLVPPDYPGHDHKWVHLDAGLSICDLCGADHICFQGHCPTVQMEHSESVCSITGCIIVLSEMQAEWAASERVQPPTHITIEGSSAAAKKRSALIMKGLSCKGHTDIHDLVEIVVTEILSSQKTIRCMAEEASRDHARKMTYLARIIRETLSAVVVVPPCSTATTAATALPQRPNMILFEAKLSWQCRKCRALLPQVNWALLLLIAYACPLCYTNTEGAQAKRHQILKRVIRLCVDNICNLVQKYGWHRVTRQLQHSTRGREFICSMLYLMRMGITYRNQVILQKMEILNDLLPLQVFLPSIFKIRAKSITEGENIIKLDIQRMPL